MSDEPKLALFIDLENVALGAEESKLQSFEIKYVLARLVEKGKIVVKTAYADWSVYKKYKKTLHETAIELIDIPQRRYSGKNSADIKMVVDAMDLCYSKDHINYFALVSGDSDFAPLVSKLKENNKTVIGVGLRKSTSDLLAAACDEFIFYDDLARPAKAKRPKIPKLPTKTKEAFQQLLDAAAALQRDNKVLHSSAVKDAMKRKQPQFNEEYHGYNSFSRLLEDAQRHKLIELKKDPRSGTYVIEEVSESAE